MSKLDDRIEVIRKEYGLRQDDFWELPQRKGTWCVKHAALEIVAAKAGISFDAPLVLEAASADGIVSMCVTGRMGDRSVWSVGECSPKNNKNSYPWAIAEKRAIDRVVLKLVGIHGLVYSEDDLAPQHDEPRQSAPTQAPQEPKQTQSNRLSKEKARGLYERLQKDLEGCANEGPDTITSLMKSDEMINDLASLPEDWEKKLKEDARALFKTAKEFFDSKGKIDPKEYIAENFPGSAEMKGE